jgi:multisubunit Na+/H+ antiporter MnhE subunit
MKPSFLCFLGGFWSLYAMAYLAALTFIPVPQGNRDFANIILGFITGTVVATVINYFFGSSDGSRKKDERASQNPGAPT